MPTPIRLNNPQPYEVEKAKDNPRGFFQIDPETLSHAFQASLAPNAMTKEAEASDEDANLLFQLWQNGQVVQASDKVEDRLYAVPKDFDSKNLMRLKAGGLLTGDESKVKFTPKAARMIRTMVLSEPNAFQKNSVKKPYSTIIAESTQAHPRSGLRLASTLDLKLYGKQEKTG